MSHPMQQINANTKGGWLHTIKVVLMSFVGLRKSNDHEKDGEKINPLYLVVVGFGGALLLVVGLMLLAQWVVATSK